MTLPAPWIGELTRVLREIERETLQHDVDIKRLWRRLALYGPGVPVGGLPLTSQTTTTTTTTTTSTSTTDDGTTTTSDDCCPASVMLVADGWHDNANAGPLTDCELLNGEHVLDYSGEDVDGHCVYGAGGMWTVVVRTFPGGSWAVQASASRLAAGQFFPHIWTYSKSGSGALCGTTVTLDFTDDAAPFAPCDGEPATIEVTIG